MNRHLYDEEALMKDYPLAARTAHPEGTVIPVGSAAIGGENLTLIAGPCAVESRPGRGRPAPSGGSRPGISAPHRQ